MFGRPYWEEQAREMNKRAADNFAKWEAAKTAEKAKRDRRRSWSDWAVARRRQRLDLEAKRRAAERRYEWDLQFLKIEEELLLKRQRQSEMRARERQTQVVPLAEKTGVLQALKDWVWPESKGG